MNFIRLGGLLLLLNCLGEAQAFAALTREALNTKYRGLKGFTATAVQSKTSPYLIKPLTSDVQLSYQNETLRWQVKGQDALEVHFPAQKPPELSGAAGMTGNMPAPARAKLLETLQAVRNLILMDPRMDEDFNLAIDGQKLLITPKPNKTQVFFQEIVLVFSPDLQLQSMLFKAQDDVTQLTFSQLKWTK